MTDSGSESDQTHDESADESTDESTESAADRAAAEIDEEEVEAERAERLDPDNRPDDAEIDNSDREFDEQKGMFTDSPGYDEAEPKFPPAGGQGA